MASGWVCENHPDQPCKVHTPALAAVPARRAIDVTPQHRRAARLPGGFKPHGE